MLVESESDTMTKQKNLPLPGNEPGLSVPYPATLYTVYFQHSWHLLQDIAPNDFEL
jgi:hypothetical protein